MTAPAGMVIPTVRRRAWWMVGWLVAVSMLGPIVAAFYLGGFLNPDGNARNLPLALVVEDRGASVGSQSVRLGNDAATAVEAGTRAELGSRVRWQRLPDRAAAVAAIDSDKVYAALVVPADFSQRLLEIAQPTATAKPPSAAELVILTNPAAGSYAGTFAQSVAASAAEQVNRDASAKLATLLTASRATLSAAWAQRIGEPVATTVTVVRPIGAHGGRGLAPFYFAVVITLGGVLAASAINIVVDLLAGRDELRLLGRTIRYPRSNASPRRLSAHKVAGVLIAASASALVTTALAIGPLGMPADRPWQLAGFAVLVAATMGTITIAATEAFGVAGSVLAVFLTTIAGVPSAGGVYPLAATPTAFRWLAGWLPLRYATDGARSLIFFDGAGASVARVSAVLAVWFAIGLALAGLAACRHARLVALGTPSAGSAAESVPGAAVAITTVTAVP